MEIRVAPSPRPACMDETEFALWHEMNDRISGGTKAV